MLHIFRRCAVCAKSVAFTSPGRSPCLSSAVCCGRRAQVFRPHTHVSSRHQHWHCKASIVTQTLLPRDDQPTPAVQVFRHIRIHAGSTLLRLCKHLQLSLSRDRHASVATRRVYHKPASTVAWFFCRECVHGRHVHVPDATGVGEAVAVPTELPAKEESVG